MPATTFDPPATDLRAVNLRKENSRSNIPLARYKLARIAARLDALGLTSAAAEIRGVISDDMYCAVDGRRGGARKRKEPVILAAALDPKLRARVRALVAAFPESDAAEIATAFNVPVGLVEDAVRDLR